MLELQHNYSKCFHGNVVAYTTATKFNCYGGQLLSEKKYQQLSAKSGTPGTTSVDSLSNICMV